MIELVCICGKKGEIPESAAGKKTRCPKCGKQLQPVCGEALGNGAGLGDFDAALVERPSMLPSPASKYLLGGVADIEIGKLADRHIVLAGEHVSRRHCKLVRVDFGPSRWKVVDLKSTNGVLVNGQAVAEQELAEGDELTIGEHSFAFTVAAPSEAAAIGTGTDPEPKAGDEVVVRADSSGGAVCPSCERSLAPGAKICVGCGIKIATGRPLLTRQGLEQEEVSAAAYQWIRWISFIVRVTPMPMPIYSDAYGGKKPYAIWTIAGLTTLCSLLFFLARFPVPGSINFDKPGKELMLFSPWGSEAHLGADFVNPNVTQKVVLKLTDADREELRRQYDPSGELNDDQLVSRAIADAYNSSRGDFHWYQLITHMLLHDTSSVLNFAMHLGGNMLFLLVFGTRVNSLLGNLATAILYPVLGVCAATVYLIALGPGAHGPMLGASGAIMGLAGVYLILFPVHRVFCAMWIRIGFLVKSYLAYKTFAIRGFWVLLIYFGYDVVMNLITSHLSTGGGGVAHWAHIGGFATGMAIGLGALVSRQFNANGGDLLAVSLGRYSWPLTGKPSQWADRNQSVLGTSAFAGGTVLVLIAALMVLWLRSTDQGNSTVALTGAGQAQGQPDGGP